MFYKDITFNTREEANDVLESMKAIINEYDSATVGDLNDLVGEKCDYRAHTFGWRDLTSARIFLNSKGTYSIYFPEPGDVTDKCSIGDQKVEDVVNHPSHYQSQSGLETIQVIDAFTADLVGTEAVCTGNVLKYICRWKHKNGLQDLEKAKWYLEHLINHIKNNEKESE